MVGGKEDCGVRKAMAVGIECDERLERVLEVWGVCCRVGGRAGAKTDSTRLEMARREQSGCSSLIGYSRVLRAHAQDVALRAFDVQRDGHDIEYFRPMAAAGPHDNPDVPEIYIARQLLHGILFLVKNACPHKEGSQHAQSKFASSVAFGTQREHGERARFCMWKDKKESIVE